MKWNSFVTQFTLLYYSYTHTERERDTDTLSLRRILISFFSQSEFHSISLFSVQYTHCVTVALNDKQLQLELATAAVAAANPSCNKLIIHVTGKYKKKVRGKDES